MTGGIILLLVIAFGIVLLGWLALRGRRLDGADELQDRIQVYAVIPDASPRRERGRRRAGLVRFRLRLNAMLSTIASENLSLQLARANLPITVPEFLLIRLGAVLAGFLLGWLFTRTLLSGAGLAAIAYVIPGIYLQRAISRRQNQFTKQISDVLVLIGGAVRAGYSLLQALEVVVREMKPPASEEFGRVVREVGLGMRLPDALRNLSVRMQNADLDLVVTAIDIQYQVGGNLSAVLNAITETIRERIRLFGEVRVLTTTQRYSSYLLSILPIVVGSMMFVMNPQYMSGLFRPGPLLCIPIGAGLGIVLGFFAIQRVAKIEV